MTEFKGTFTPPPFGEDDVDNIKNRLLGTYEGVSDKTSGEAKAYIEYLAHIWSDGQVLDRLEWHNLRAWARELPDEAQQLKTDLFRLLKAVKVSDGGE